MRWVSAVFRLVFLLLTPVCLSFAAVLLFSQDTEEESERPKFSVQAYSSLVEARVVTGTGEFVTGLSASDFRITSNLQELKILHFEELSNSRISLAVLIDIGSEMTQDKILTSRRAVFELIHALDPVDEVLLAVYDQDIHFLSELTIDRSVLVKALDNVASGGRPGFWTRLSHAFASSGNTGFAVDHTLLKIKDASYNKVLLVFSSSFGNMGNGTREHLDLAGARLFAITWKNNIGNAFNLWSDRVARGDVLDSSGGMSFKGTGILEQMERLKKVLSSFYLIAYESNQTETDREDLRFSIRNRADLEVQWARRLEANNPFF